MADDRYTDDDEYVEDNSYEEERPKRERPKRRYEDDFDEEEYVSHRKEILRQRAAEKKEQRLLEVRRQRRRFIIFGIIAFLLVDGILCYIFLGNKIRDKFNILPDLPVAEKKEKEKSKDKDVTEMTEVATVTEATPAEAEREVDVLMSFAGDCNMATNLEDASYGTMLWYLQNYPSTYFFEPVESYFQEDDFTVVNCEGVFSDSTCAPRDKGEGINFWFRAPSKYACVFADNDIEAVSINNNHTNDYGPECFEDTQKALDSFGTQWGFRDKLIILEKDGYKIAVMCCSFYSYEEAEGVVEWLKQAEEVSDFQVVFFHGGTERLEAPEDWKVNACHMLVDEGADLILGSHPHVLQPRENYNGVDIVYSLGNFCFGGNTGPQPNRTIIYQYKLHAKGIPGNFITESKEENIIPCYVYTGSSNNWQPAPIEDEETKNNVIRFMNGELATLH